MANSPAAGWTVGLARARGRSQAFRVGARSIGTPVLRSPLPRPDVRRRTVRGTRTRPLPGRANAGRPTLLSLTRQICQRRLTSCLKRSMRRPPPRTGIADGGRAGVGSRAVTARRGGRGQIRIESWDRALGCTACLLRPSARPISSQEQPCRRRCPPEVPPAARPVVGATHAPRSADRGVGAHPLWR